tara:strand:- start:588 stop:1568 length:981 start_codon:yes stop_codon:yes gene_type:complete
MPSYDCDICNFSTQIKPHFTRHLNTKKHQKKYNEFIRNETINKKKVYTPAQNQHKPAQIPNLTSTTPAQNQHNTSTNQHKPAQTSTNILFCDYCHQKFKTTDNKTRHMRKYCKMKKTEEYPELKIQEETKDSPIKEKEKEKDDTNKILKDLLHEQKQMFNEERKELYKQIELLLDKVGNTTNIQSNIKNTIHLNSYGNEDLSHITDSLKTQLLRVPFAMIPKMIEAVHFNDERPENKNISLSNIRDNKIKIFTDNKWIYKDKDETINDLVDGKYYILDNHFEHNSTNLEDESKGNYVKFREFLNKEDKELYTKMKKQCELVLLNNR